MRRIDTSRNPDRASRQEIIRGAHWTGIVRSGKIARFLFFLFPLFKEYVSRLRSSFLEYEFDEDERETPAPVVEMESGGAI